jgi:hypothetical protein
MKCDEIRGKNNPQYGGASSWLRLLGFLIGLSTLITMQACIVAATQKPVFKMIAKREAIVDHLPDGWSWDRYNSFESIHRSSHFLPDGQDQDHWQEQITVVQPKLSGTPAENIDTMDHLAFGHLCEGYKVEEIEATTRNGYPTATKLMYCGRDRRSEMGKGGVAIYKAINAKSGPYVIVRQVRLDAFDVNNQPLSSEKKSELLNWAKGIHMCDSGDPTQQCPPDKSNQYTLTEGKHADVNDKHAVIKKFDAPKHSDEQTVNHIPFTWKLVHHDVTAAKTILRYVPQDQTDEKWNEMVAVQVFHGMRALPLEVFEKHVNWSLEAHCAGYSRGKIQQKIQNNYVTASVVEYCGKHNETGKGGITVFKAIAGQDAFVVANWTLLVKPFAGREPPVSDAKWAELMDWLEGVQICYARDSTRPCPPDKY